MRNKLILKKQPNNTYTVYYTNGTNIGTFEPAEDGYLYFGINPDGSGYWNANILRLIADKLDEMNKKWDEQVKKELSKTI